MTAVHQFVPTLEPGAVGAHVLQIRRLARDLGYASEVFTEHVHPTMEDVGRDFRQYGRGFPAGRDDVLVYQTAIGSNVADFVLGRAETIAVNYHNITPARFFASWEPGLVHGLLWGRAQLSAMAERSALGIAVSRYNEAELAELGYGRTAVVPVLVDLAAFEADADPAAEERLVDAQGEGAAWLFVGRVAPNKAQHDLIKAFAAYRRTFDPDAVLRIVGASSSGAYLLALRSLVHALDLDGAVEMTGAAVTAGELAAQYRAADVFVCCSEHEGFCVPLLEAMHHRLPVVAFRAAAVAETLGGAGLCLPSKTPTMVAAAVARVVDDGVLSRQLVDAGAARLADFDLAVTRRRMAEALQALVSP